jgi:autotransporter-associated beta strand protein
VAGTTRSGWPPVAASGRGPGEQILGIEALKTRHARAAAFTLVVSFAIGWASGATAQTPNNSWLGGSPFSGPFLWSNGGNWTGSNPVSSDVVGFNQAGSQNPALLDVDPTVAGMLMNATGNNTLDLNGSTLTLTGLSTQSGGTITGTGTVSLTGSGTFAASGTAVLGNGVTISTAGLANTVTLSGINFGGTITGGGSLTTNGSVVLGGGTSNYTGGSVINGGTLTLGTNNALSTASGLTINSGASLSLNGFSQTVAGLNGAGSIALVDNSLTVNGGGTFSGTIDGLFGDLIKTGAGTLTLSGTNTYGAGTVLTGGTIAVGSNSALGAGTLTMANGTTLQAASGV